MPSSAKIASASIRICKRQPNAFAFTRITPANVASRDSTGNVKRHIGGKQPHRHQNRQPRRRQRRRRSCPIFLTNAHSPNPTSTAPPASVKTIRAAGLTCSHP